jgi:hypothetical protein
MELDYNPAWDRSFNYNSSIKNLNDMFATLSTLGTMNRMIRKEAWSFSWSIAVSN